MSYWDIIPPRAMVVTGKSGCNVRTYLCGMKFSKQDLEALDLDPDLEVDETTVEIAMASCALIEEALLKKNPLKPKKKKKR